jgi:hypothetical protein
MTDMTSAIYGTAMIWYTTIPEFKFTSITVGLHRIDFHASLHLPTLIKKLISPNYTPLTLDRSLALIAAGILFWQ